MMVIANNIAIWPVIFCAILVFAGSLILTARFAERLLLADTPNERSSHATTTSRAGGIAIMAAWIVGLIIAIITGLFSGPLVGSILIFAGLTLIAALFGVLDDGFNLRPIVKFVGQVLPAVLFVSIFGGVTSAPLPFVGTVEFGTFAVPLSIFWIVAMMNAYNFMDGVNGLAPGCGALALLVIAIIAVGAGNILVAAPALFLAAALAGFLPGNLARGKIFMGDSGSQAIGFVLAALGILLPSAPSNNFAISPLLVPVMMLPFIADVTFTLLHRMKRRRNIVHAHREHSYQLLTRMGLSHGEVTAIYLAMVAVCCSAAVALLSIPTIWQPAVPICLLALFGIFAIRIFNAANARSLIADAPEHPVIDLVDEELLESVQVQHAAE